MTQETGKKLMCQHFVSGSQATGLHKGACSKRATQRVIGFAMYDLVNPVVCGRHARFWNDRGFTVVPLEPAWLHRPRAWRKPRRRRSPRSVSKSKSSCW